MIKLQTIKSLLNASSESFPEDLSFKNISINSRELQPGDLFIACKGDNFDGHDFILDAQKKGAIAVIAHKKIDHLKIPALLVDDTIQALGKLGAWKRQQFSLPVLAVTGSCGKTTTKEMLAAILSRAGHTLVSKKSFNNSIGVPLTLWQLNENHQFAVLEIGANHHGEIADLIKIIRPLSVAAITNAESCHLEGFGDLDGVARAKGEIFQGFTNENKNCFAIINADSPYHNYWEKLIDNHNKITFGLAKHADVSAENISLDKDSKPNFTLILPNAKIQIQLSLPGRHNVMNALTAAACAYAIGIDAEIIKGGLENTTPVYSRLVLKKGINDATIIDDTYNAQPPSVKAALEFLATQKGCKVFVFAWMGELGSDAEKWHHYIGAYAKELGIDYLFVWGKFSKIVAQSFGSNSFSFDTQEELTKELLKILDANKVVLVKGSRSTKMENVVGKLLITEN